jgi:hypothetical protein
MNVKKVMCILILGWVSFLASSVLANVSGQSISIMIDQPIHFWGVDGSDALIAPGTYTVEAADTWLRLVPGERRDAILLDAEVVMHQEAIVEPVASLTSVDNDTQEIALLLPGGTGLKALGTYSGVLSRGVYPGKQSNRLVLRTPATSSPKSTPRPQERYPQVMQKKREGGILVPDDPWDKLLLDLIQQQGQKINGLQAKVEKLKIHKHTFKPVMPGLDGISWVTLGQLLEMDDDHSYVRNNFGTWFGPQKKDRGQTGEILISEPKY